MSASQTLGQQLVPAQHVSDGVQYDEARPLPPAITLPMIVITSAGLWVLIYKAACGLAAVIR